MKKRWMCILLVLGLTLALACSTALAEDELVPVFHFDNPNTSIAIVPEEARDVITPSDWINGMTLDNMEELISAYGETIPGWSFELVDGEDVEAYDGEQEMEHAVFHFGRQPENDGDITYRVSCDWNGHVGTNEITFTAATLQQDDLPTGDTLQDLYVIGAGETLTVVGDLIPSDWRVPGREDECYFGLWDYDFTHQNPEDYTITEIDEITATFTSNKPGIYVLNGFISRGGVTGGHAVCILVTGDESPVHISAQPGTDVVTCETYSVAAAAPGAEAIRLYYATQEYVENNGLDESAVWAEAGGEAVYGDASDNARGTWVFAASALLEGEWTDPWDCMLSVNVDAPNGELSGGLLTLSALEIQPAESIDITFNQIENAENVGGYMWGDHGADCPELNMNDFGTTTVSGGDLTPGGIYYVSADAMALGYEHHWEIQTFMVNYEDASISDDPNSTLTIRTPGTEIETFTNHPFTLYAPGANAVSYVVYRVNDEGGLEEEFSDWSSSCGIYVPDCLNRSNPGVFVLKARACYGDIEEENSWTNEDDCQITFTIDNPNGWLSAPNGWTSMSAAQGDSIEIHFDGNENAQSYGYWYRLEDGGEGLGGDGVSVDENTEFPLVMYLPTDELQPGALYRIMLDVDAPGYGEGHRENLFIVEGAPDDNITFTTPDSLCAGQVFDVHVDAPGADQVIICTSIDGCRWSDGYNEEEGYSEGYAADCFGMEGGTVWVWAAAHIDGSWNHVTECRAIPVSPALGRVNSPSFSLTHTEVLRGDFVKATLGAVEQDAYSYRVYFCNEEGQWYGDYGRGDAGDIYIPTGDLPAGIYTVHGYVRAVDYLNGETEEDLTFTVSDPDDYPGGLYVLNPELQTKEKLMWSLYAKGADHVALCVTDDPENLDASGDFWLCDRDGDSDYERDWLHTHFNYPGNLYAFITAHFYNEETGEGWLDIVGDPVSLYVSAPSGEAPASEIEYAPLTAVGEDYTFTVRSPENTVYRVRVAWDGDWGSELLQEENCRGERSFTLDKQYIDNPDSFVIQIWTRFEDGVVGYTEHYQNYIFRAEENPGSDRVTVTAETYEKLINDGDVLITVSAPGAEQLKLCNYWGEFDSRDGDTWERGVGEEMIYAQALIDGEWYTSEAITIHWISYGECEAVYAVLAETSLIRGELLTVTVPESEHAAWYNLTIRDSDNNDHCYRQLEAPGTYALGTATLEPGREYCVCVSTGAVGYTWSNNDWHIATHFTVTEPEGGALTLEKTEVLTYENIAVSAYAPGAERIRFSGGYRGENNPGWWSDEYGWDGDSFVDVINWNREENETIARVEGLYDGEWRLIDEQTVRVSAPYGKAPAPEIECDLLAAVDEDYVFTVRPAENMVYTVSVVWDGDWGFNLMSEDDCQGEKTFTVDKQYIDNPDHFVLRVWTRPKDVAYGYEEDYQEIHFRSEYNPYSDRVTITAETYEKLINDGDVLITVSAPGAEQLKLCNYWGEFASAEGETWNHGVCDEMVYAQALIDGEWYTSEAITIQWISYGPCGVVDPVLAETSLIRGELLTVTVPEAEHAEWYHLRIWDNDGNEYCFRDVDAPGTYALSTGNLEPDGEYFVTVSTGAVGYDWSENDRDTATRFTVTEPEGNIFAVEKTEVLTHESIAVSVYAPVAERIRFSSGYHGEEDPGWWDEYGWDGDNWYGWGINWSHAENGIILRAEGLYDGEWRLIDQQTVTVSAPNGSVPAPEIEYERLAAVGEDYTFTVKPADNFVYSVSVVWDGDWGFNLMSENDCRGESTFTVDKQYIDNPDNFVLRVWTRPEDGVYGYEEDYQEIRFRAEYNPYSDRVTLNVEKTEALVNEDVQATVSAPGAERLTLCNEWGEFDSRDGDTWERGVGDALVYAQALIDGEWYTSEPVMIHRISYGQCAPAEPELAKTSLIRGELLAITIPESEHAEWYHIHIRDDDWNEYCFRDDGAPGTYTLPTGNLEPDREYFVIVSTGAVGYDWNENDRNTATRFTVTEPESGFLSVEKTEVLTFERIAVSVYAPGAERIRFSNGYRGENDPGWWDEYGWDGDNWDGRGINWSHAENGIILRAEGMYDGEWRLIDEQTVSVTAPYGKAAAPEIVCERIAAVNEDYSFTVKPAENVIYTVSVVWDGNWDFDLLREDDCRGEGTFTVDKQYIDNPDNFVLRVWTRPENVACGYEEDYQEIRFRAEYNPYSDRVTLNVEKTEALVNEDVRVTVSAPGAERLTLCNERGEFDSRDGDTWERGVGEEMIYAQALIDGEWYTSEPVMIHRTSYGQCAPAEPELAETSLIRGELLTITVPEAEHAEWYHLRIWDNDGNECCFRDNGAPGTYVLPTGNLEPDREYFVTVSTGAVGYDWNENDRDTAARFTVTEPTSGVLTVENTEPLTLERIEVSVVIPGAECIRFSNHYAGENEPEWWDGSDWNGDSGSYICDWPDYAGDYTVAAEGMFNGQWSGDVLTQTVHVTAPNGQLDEAHITAEPYQNIQDGLSFDVTLPDGAAYYYVEVWENIEDGERVWKLNNSERYGDDSFHVDAGSLELGHTYTIYTNTRGYGYECHETGVEVTMVADMTAPEFSISTHFYITEAGFRMTGFATLNGQPMDRFLLELDSPNNHWTEYWCVYDETNGWSDNSTPCFPWGTQEQGSWCLRIAPCNEDGVQTGPWSEWQYFEADGWALENMHAFRLPGNLRTVFSEAFANTDMEIVYIPASVTEIQSGAFAECGNLKVAVFEGNGDMTIAQDAFADCPNVIFLAEEYSPAWQWALDNGQNTMAR